MDEKTLLEELKEYGVSNRLYNQLNLDGCAPTWAEVLKNPEIIKQYRNVGETSYQEFLQFLRQHNGYNFFKKTIPFKSPSDILLDIELPLHQRVQILNPIYIPKLNEQFIVEFSNFIQNKKITEELEDMDDSEQFKVTDYYTVLYKDRVIIYITLGWEEVEEEEELKQ